MSVSFTQNDEQESIIKDHSTIAELIAVLQELPQDLEVDAQFQVHVVDGTVAFLQDQRVVDLMNIIMGCPLCSQGLKEQEAVLPN